MNRFVAGFIVVNDQAVVHGSIDRVVPILMTALCTRLASMPVAAGR